MAALRFSQQFDQALEEADLLDEEDPVGLGRSLEPQAHDGDTDALSYEDVDALMSY